MGIFFSKHQNIQQKYDKISIKSTRETVQESIIESVQESIIESVQKSIIESVQESIIETVQEPVQEPTTRENIQSNLETISIHFINKDLKKEINSNPLFRIVKNDTHNDKENINEHKNKHNKHKNKKKIKKNKKEIK